MFIKEINGTRQYGLLKERKERRMKNLLQFLSYNNLYVSMTLQEATSDDALEAQVIIWRDVLLSYWISFFF